MTNDQRLRLIAINTGKIRRKNIIGKTYERLTVVEFCGRDKNNNGLYKCRCSCGGETITRSFMLNSGRTKSCGCIQKETASVLNLKPRVPVENKTCPTCGELKEATLFGNDKSRPDGLTAQCKKCKNVRYKQNNKGSVNHNHAKRKRMVKQATPPWANMEDIEAIYKEAAMLSDKNNIKYHVDHIMPINSKLLCGLHVPWNLQILTESENCAKRNHI